MGDDTLRIGAATSDFEHPGIDVAFSNVTHIVRGPVFSILETIEQNKGEASHEEVEQDKAEPIDAALTAVL